MINKKRNSRLLFLLGTAGFALSVFFCPASNLSVQAATSSEIIAQPQRDDIRWRFTIMDNKVYKRLYNYSTCNWIGDWIYLRDVPEGFEP